MIFSKFRFFLLQPPKGGKQLNPSQNFRMRGAEKCARPTQAPGRPILAEQKKFQQNFPWKKWKCSGPRLKVELTLENGKITSNTGSKGHV